MRRSRIYQNHLFMTIWQVRHSETFTSWITALHQVRIFQTNSSIKLQPGVMFRVHVQMRNTMDISTEDVFLPCNINWRARCMPMSHQLVISILLHLPLIIQLSDPASSFNRTDSPQLSYVITIKALLTRILSRELSSQCKTILLLVQSETFWVGTVLF